MIFVLYMLGHVFDFWKQRWFIYAEGFKLLPDLLLLRFIDDVHFVSEVKLCRLAFIAIDTIKEKCPGLPDYARIVKHRFHAKDSFNILWVNHILEMRFLVLNFMQKILDFLFGVELIPIQFSQIFDTEIYWAFGDIRNDTDSIAIKIFNIWRLNFESDISEFKICKYMGINKNDLKMLLSK